MTRAEIRALILDWADDPQGTYFTSDLLNKRINLAQRELQKAMITANKQYCALAVKTDLVVGQSNYALPSNFIQIIRLEYVMSGSGDTAITQALKPMTPNQRDNTYQYSGDPLFYVFNKNDIVLQPVPNTVRELRLTYSYMVADLTSDSQSPDLPEQFHEYIAVIATRDCFLKDGRGLAPIQAKLDDYKATMRQIAEQRNVDTPRMVVATRGGW